MEIGSTLSRLRLGLLILVVLGFGLLLPGTGQAACTNPDQDSGEHCTAFPSTPWAWINYTYTDLGPFPTLEFLTEAIRARALTWSQRCSFTLTSAQYDIYGVGYAVPGFPETENSHYHRLGFTDVISNGGVCNQTQTTWVDVFGQRFFSCPAGQSLVYSYGPPKSGPYCAMPWSAADVGKSAGCPDCKNGEVGKGNPIVIGSFNKYQREDDYRGAGHHPLTASRHYNSILIKNYTP